MAITLSFLRGAGTVTGSKFLVETGDHRILVVAVCSRGLKELRFAELGAFSG